MNEDLRMEGLKPELFVFQQDFVVQKTFGKSADKELAMVLLWMQATAHLLAQEIKIAIN